MRLTLTKCIVRSYEASDAPALAKYANNSSIARNLRDAFPHPYTEEHGKQFIELAQGRNPESFFCIEVNGEAAGGIGFSLHGDVERLTAEIGYWLAEPFWNRGIMTEALAAVSEYALREHHLVRLYAEPYEWNAASMRVLEKCGYLCEGRMRKSIIKDGVIADQLLWAKVIDD